MKKKSDSFNTLDLTDRLPKAVIDLNSFQTIRCTKLNQVATRTIIFSVHDLYFFRLYILIN